VLGELSFTRCLAPQLVLDQSNPDWWKVKILEEVGFVPASMLEVAR
jgi:hypothetical protein